VQFADDPVLRRSPAAWVLAQGLPLALGLASHAAINLVDLAMVGRLGGDAVQAAHVGSTWNFLPMIVGNCVSTALLAQASRRLGAGDAAGARAFNRRAQWLMLWLGLLLGAATALPAASMADLMRVEGAARSGAIAYLVVSNLGCAPMFVLMQTTAAMRAAGEAAMPLLLLLGANALNLALAVPLLFGWEAIGLQPVGVVGAALAAVAARSVAAVVGVLWLSRRSHPLSLRRAAAAAGAPPAVVRPLLADAWPQAVQIGLRAALVLVLTPLVRARGGEGALVALGITTRFDTVVLFASLGFANAATAYAARAAVAGRGEAARAAGLWAGLYGGLLGVLVVAAMAGSSAWLVTVCLPAPPEPVLAAAAAYFGSASWGQALGAVALGAMGAIQGAGRMRLPLLGDVIGFAAVYGALAMAAQATVSEPAASPDRVATLYGALVGGMAVVAAVHLALVRWGGWVDAAPRQNGSAARA
jgi:Na+-driven multidrug efflux pump